MTAVPQVKTLDATSSQHGLTDTAPVGFDRQAVTSWLELLHGTSPGLMHLCSDAARGQKSNWSGRTFSDVADAVDYAERLDRRGDKGIYVRTTTLSRPIGVFERGGEKDSKALPGFAFDIDIAGPGHKHKAADYEGRELPPDAETAMAVVTSTGLPEPTLWVHSGGGLYPWFMFHEPIDVSEPLELELAQAVFNKIDKVLFHAFKEAGYHYGTGVTDAARVLRLPGTVNRKDNAPPRPCRVLDPASYVFHEFGPLDTTATALWSKLPVEKAPIPVVSTQIKVNSGTLSPGDDFENKVDWGDSEYLLPSAGWEFVYQRGQTRHWRRPGKDHGTPSATTGHAGDRDRLYVMSTESYPFPYKEPVTKFHAYALLHHNGDHSVAGKFLRTLGFGESKISDQPANPTSLADLIRPAQGVSGSPEVVESTPTDIPAVEAVTVDDVPAIPVVKAHGFYRPTDIGNGHRMADKYTASFKWCGDENLWYEWDGKLWREDRTQSLIRAAEAMTEDIFAESKVLSAEDEKKGAALHKHATTSQSQAKINAAIRMFSAREEVTKPSSAFDSKSEQVTVHNGTLNINTGELVGFIPSLLARRMFNAKYDPAAKCPKFLAFLEKVLPDPTMRAYIQRAMGYTLKGDVNQKAMFILWGPSHTGKSQFLILMEKLFGDFGSTAAASAFRETKSESSNNLHDLKGKRFVTTSETSETAKINEELVKRLTGKDNVVSRQLYEKNLTWTPEMTIWMATNFLPKLSGDDDAMWRRVKPIHFNTVFSDEPGAANAEVIDIAESIFAEEASGILNWILEGVRELNANGLNEPTVVKDAVATYKLESNNVAEFIEDTLNTDILVRNAEASEAIEMSKLFTIYEEWCKRQRIEHPYGQKRFGNRIRALGYEVRKISNMRCIGLSSTMRHGLFGTM